MSYWFCNSHSHTCHHWPWTAKLGLGVSVFGKEAACLWQSVCSPRLKQFWSWWLCGGSIFAKLVTALEGDKKKKVYGHFKLQYMPQFIWLSIWRVLKFWIRPRLCPSIGLVCARDFFSRHVSVIASRAFSKLLQHVLNVAYWASSTLRQHDFNIASRLSCMLLQHVINLACWASTPSPPHVP